MKEAKVKIDIFKPVPDQVKEIVKEISVILPIRIEKLKASIKISGSEYSKVYSDIKRYSEIIKENWQSDGSWHAVVTFPAGLKTEFYNILNSRTKGKLN